jgi:hypothetical protein
MRTTFAAILLVAASALACGSSGGGAPDDAVANDAVEAAGDVASEDVATADPVGDETATDVDAGPPWPACGTHSYSWQGLIPGPGDPGFDADLDALARKYDRCWATFNTPFGLNADSRVSVANAANRTLVEDYVRNSDSWDFKAHSGKEVAEVIESWGDSVGMYGGAGAAADALRYMVLRDRGEDCAEVERARARLLPVLDGLHIATAITGVPGVIARSIASKALPGNADRETTPLFDADGKALPYEKNNGTLREDNSGLYPDWIWTDSCSRDMLVGWAQAYAAVAEAMRGDPSFDEALKQRLRDDAKAIGTSLSIVRESGYDLEIRDADGRMTYHGVLNENSIDRDYVEGGNNGFYAMMALGIVSGLAYAAEDQGLVDYVRNELIGKRHLELIARDHMLWVDMGVGSNFSNFNMAFTGAWLALRYTPDAASRAVLREATAHSLYDVPGSTRQPAEMKQSWFDFIQAGGATGHSVFDAPSAPPDEVAVAHGVETLKEFKVPPFWDFAIENCDAAELESKSCTAVDGTHIDVLGALGWKGDVVAKAPVPMRLRPPSNYYWRSNPYQFNGGGDGSGLLPAVDFRVAYWTGRFTRR